MKSEKKFLGYIDLLWKWCECSATEITAENLQHFSYVVGSLSAFSPSIICRSVCDTTLFYILLSPLEGVFIIAMTQPFSV
ncbi:hypothetical protein GDO78_013059 [Eleutherodactylus coqui]|uniref:Uncharacterized protein n=1 Tax=Eleutherodactylus coqui TaxID=57060 RepID=A0A8J6F0B0_ELECQ|nr:hypothetical protein GDO78_013059 [Eleutherodactylus coqui]